MLVLLWLINIFFDMNLGNRITELRKKKGVTRNVLAEEVSVSVPQLVRYETKDVQPPADVLKRLSSIFGVSIDYIVNGDINNKANETINDSQLLLQFKAVEQMNDEDKSIISKLIDAFITKRKIQDIL